MNLTEYLQAQDPTFVPGESSRPRNHQDLDAFIFRIEDGRNKDIYHVEIYNKFTILGKDDLRQLGKEASELSGDSQAFLLAKIIEDLVGQTG